MNAETATDQWKSCLHCGHQIAREAPVCSRCHTSALVDAPYVPCTGIGPDAYHIEPPESVLNSSAATPIETKTTPGALNSYLFPGLAPPTLNFTEPEGKPGTAPSGRQVSVDLQWPNWFEDAIRTLIVRGDFEQALGIAAIYTACDPKSARPHALMGGILRSSGHIDKAIEVLRRALAIAPDAADIHRALGAALYVSGDLDESEELLTRALEAAPSNVYTLQNLMCSVLAKGDLPRGWNLHYRRRKIEEVNKQIIDYPLPMWDGRRKERVLIVGEEGPGERIMFGSVIQDAIDTGADIHIDITEHLTSYAPLFARSWPSAKIIMPETKIDLESQVLMGDLPALFRRSFDAFPKHGGFLRPDPERKAAYRKRLEPGPVVGISWRSRGKNEVHKSIPLKHWKPVLSEKGVHFVDLQYSNTEAERDEFAPLVTHLPDLTIKKDADGTAALIAACDLVITTSSLTAHMAGGLGVPCWVILPQAEARMWFWFMGREDSPWYPSVRLVRPPRGLDFTTIMRTVSYNLQKWLLARKEEGRNGGV